MSPIFTPPRTWCYFAQLVVLAFTLNSPERVQALVVGAAVLPHGDFAFDPSLVGNKNHSLELHKGAQAVGAAVAALRPDIIVLTTPHGIESERDFAFYRNTNGSGFAHLGDDLHNASFPGYDVNLNISMNPSIVHNLTASLLAMDTRANVSTLLSFADGEAQALRWGEVVPLKLVFDQYKELAAPLAGKTPELPSVVVWSVPSRRYTETDTMVGSGELTRLGLNLATALERLDERVVVLVSADLAHTHLASGPYGFSKDAEPFDEACGTWARTLNSSQLLSTALRHAVNAESCGYTGLVVLDGFLSSFEPTSALLQSSADHKHENRRHGSLRSPVSYNAPPLQHTLTPAWNSTLVVGPFHPTYYGMMTAMFARQDTRF